MKSRRTFSRSNRRKTQKMIGGYLCSEKDRYTMGELLGKGEEGNVYVDENNPDKVIKQFSPIMVSHPPTHKKKIKEFQRIFKLSKRIGDLEIGPKVYYYKICKQNVSVNFSEKPPIFRQRMAAKFPIRSKEYNLIKNPDITVFNYQIYVPYLVMQRIKGHEITMQELDTPEIMEKVYMKYVELCNNKIGFTDIHMGNIIVRDNVVYFIDFSSAVVLRKVPNIKSREDLKNAIIENDNEHYKISPLSETSIDSQISESFTYD
jgi:RIO-like serine/threonine protein kinase